MPQPLRFAHFEVLMRSDGSPHLLGQGAMGSTFKALDQNLLSLAVIKVPSVELLSNPAARQRFLQEAQMMARLRHPHVANVFYYGDSDSGPFYAMEFCDGPSLHDYVDEQGTLDVADAFRVALQTASALQALDAHELIHRDLKPSNIILTSDAAGAAHIKLIDFGVAREGLPADTGGLTLGGFIGTPAFASPEQLLEATHLDSRSDLYSLGAVMWFCLTGAPPFVGSQFEIMFHHVNTEPDWSQLPEMPESHLQVLQRLLAKSAEERYGSPALLVQALQNLLGIVTTHSHRLHLRSAGLDTSNRRGGYEPLETIGADDFGKVWIARDILTHNVVSLREFPPEFAQKQAIILRLQRLTAFLRSLEHPLWLRLLHFEQSGTDCRLATERVSGPSALQLLKIHQQLSLEHALPLLSQVAEAMDAGASEGLIAMETALERLPICIQGWDDLDESAQYALLRRPMNTWSNWSVKVCPLRLSHSAQDYALPSDSMAAKAITRISADFVQLCYRLLTGQVRSPSAGGNVYVPSPSLSAESNDFFERHFTVNQRSQSPQSCHTLLRLLCIAEGVTPPQSLDDDGNDPLATRVVTRRTLPLSLSYPPKTSISSEAATVIQSPHANAAPTSEPNDDTLLTPFGISALMESETFMAAVGAPISDRRRDLDKRRAELEEEAERLREDERAQAERDWIARERAELEAAKQQIANLELERAQRLAEEQARLAEQKQQLEQQQILLEEKRREQQRLEQEIQLRAQLDFQKLQEEAKLRESDLLRQRAAMEQALRERERDFQQREKQTLEKLEALKREAAQIEETVQQEFLTVRQIEVAHSRRLQDEFLVEEIARQTLAEEERKLEAIRKEFAQRSASQTSTAADNEPATESAIEPKSEPSLDDVEDPKSVPSSHSISNDEVKESSSRNIRAWLYLLIPALAIFLGIASAYVLKSKLRIKPTLLAPFTSPSQSDSEPLWNPLKAKLDEARLRQDWKALLIEVADTAKQQPQLLQTHQAEIHSEVKSAIQTLIQNSDLRPSIHTKDANDLIAALSLLLTLNGGFADSHLHLLLAKLVIPKACSECREAEAIDQFLIVHQQAPELSHLLQPEFDLLMNSYRSRLAKDQIDHHQQIIETLTPLQNAVNTTQAKNLELLFLQLNLDQSIHQSQPQQALSSLLHALQTTPDWKDSLKPLAQTILQQMINHPAVLEPNIHELIQQTSAIWNLPEAYILLATISKDPKTRLTHLQKAAATENSQVAAMLSRSKLEVGLAESNQVLIDEGLSELRAAANQDEPEAMVVLAEVLIEGLGVAEDLNRALDLASRAQTKQHDKAPLLISQILIKQGEIHDDPSYFEKARQTLQKAISNQQPGAYYCLHKSFYNQVTRQPDRAYQALKEGAKHQDPHCLFTLGVWHEGGFPPAKQDSLLARQLMEQAAKLGHQPAKDWLIHHPD